MKFVSAKSVQVVSSLVIFQLLLSSCGLEPSKSRRRHSSNSLVNSASAQVCAKLQDPREILRCVAREFESPLPKSVLLDYLKASVKVLNAANLRIEGEGPFGILRKTGGNNCEGFSCDILCRGQGRDQIQWDVLLDMREPIWHGPLTYEGGIRVDECVVEGGGGPGKPPETQGSGLLSNQSLLAGNKLVSPDGSTKLSLQGDGNLVVYRNGEARWASHTGGQPGSAVMQGDGNFVLYRDDGAAIWASGTNGNNNSSLSVNNDGTFTISNASGAVLWRSGEGAAPTPPSPTPPGPTPPGPTPPAPPGPSPTGSVLLANQDLQRDQSISSPDGSATLVLQGDGNFVLYHNGAAKWSTSTFNEPGRAVMQGDGNFVLYSPSGSPLWSSGTHGSSDSKLEIRNDGSIVILSASGAVLWRAGG